jgi:hypothetical protein
MDTSIDYKDLYEKLLIDYNLIKDKLKTYTAPKRNKIFYENHKDEIKEKVKEYRLKTGYKNIPTTEQKKEYNKKAYEKRKLKNIEIDN